VRAWESHIRSIEHCYNKSFRSAVQSSPKTVMFGVDFEDQPLTSEEHYSVIRFASLSSKRAQEHWARKHQKNHPKRPEIIIGDVVLMRKDSFNKLEEPWDGPFHVTGRHGSRMYWISRSESDPFGPVHAHQLKVINHEENPST